MFAFGAGENGGEGEEAKKELAPKILEEEACVLLEKNIAPEHGGENEEDGVDGVNEKELGA